MNIQSKISTQRGHCCLFISQLDPNPSAFFFDAALWSFCSAGGAKVWCTTLDVLQAVRLGARAEAARAATRRRPDARVAPARRRRRRAPHVGRRHARRPLPLHFRFGQRRQGRRSAETQAPPGGRRRPHPRCVPTVSETFANDLPKYGRMGDTFMLSTTPSQTNDDQCPLKGWCARHKGCCIHVLAKHAQTRSLFPHVTKKICSICFLHHFSRRGRVQHAARGADLALHL